MKVTKMFLILNQINNLANKLKAYLYFLLYLIIKFYYILVNLLNEY